MPSVRVEKKPRASRNSFGASMPYHVAASLAHTGWDHYMDIFWRRQQGWWLFSLRPLLGMDKAMAPVWVVT